MSIYLFNLVIKHRKKKLTRDSKFPENMLKMNNCSEIAVVILLLCSCNHEICPYPANTAKFSGTLVAVLTGFLCNSNGPSRHFLASFRLSIIGESFYIFAFQYHRLTRTKTVLISKTTVIPARQSLCWKSRNKQMLTCRH